MSAVVYRILRTISFRHRFYIIDIAYSNNGTVCLSVTNIPFKKNISLPIVEDIKLIIPNHSFLDVSPNYSSVHYVLENDVKLFVSFHTTSDKLRLPFNFKTYLNEKPLKPHGIASCKSSNEILVCLWNRKYRDQSEGKVVKLGHDNAVVLEIESDKNIPLFVYPTYIAENGNGDICVSDVRAVVVTDAGGMLRFRYQGKFSNSKLDPYGICCDSLCNIIVADMKNDKIHVIDNDGEFLHHVIYEAIKMPRAICLDEHDNLYVAEWDTDSIKVIAR